MNKLDKKQIPQFAALCVLSAGVFGYFVVKIVTPSPAAARTRPSPVAGAPAATPTPSHPAGQKATGQDALPVEDEAEAPAPTPGMRDPFVVGYLDPKSQPAPPVAPLPAAPLPAAHLPGPAKAAVPQVASIHEVGPAPVAAPALPFSLKGLAPLPAAPAPSPAPKQAAIPAPPAPPVWTVTGVLQNEAGQVAVLRDGEARRIVRTGDFVDGVYRVVSVTRTAVVLRHEKTFYHLTLGGAKPGASAPAAPAPVRPASLPVRASVSVSVPTPGDAPKDARLSPLPRPAAQTAIAGMVGAALRLARSYMAPAQLRVDACFLAFRVRPTETPFVATLPPDGWMPAPVPEAVPASLELSRDVYGSGHALGDRAEWQCALATDELKASGEAGKQADRYN